ncbi:MAG TPA: hypothetical protein VFV78_02370 [Vicinamibacterales bacterium]|nr:hypothetical protein [Vicinamibacterales bacterium]
MKQLTLNAIGLIAGLLAGFVLVPQPLLARFSPAQVTWSGSQCPVGQYTITSTASNVSTGERFQTTSTNVRLPVQGFAQNFSDLPPGIYRVTAQSVDLAGRTFQSDEQSITIAGTPGTPMLPKPAPVPPSDSGHRRPVSSPSTGIANPRVPIPTEADHGGGARSHGEAIAGDPAPISPSSLASRIQTEVSLAWLLGTLEQFTAVRHGGASVVREIAIVDEDADGTVDYVRAILGNRPFTWKIAR